jgi:O-antigen ligase
MFIALVCLTFLLIYTKRIEHRLSLFVFCPAIAALVITIFSTVSDFAVHRVTMLFDSERALESRTSGRSDLYIAAWRLFRQHPLGVGTGGFGREFANLGDRDLIFVGKDIQAHSAWTKTLVENGLPGFILLVCYVFSFAVTGIRSHVRGAAAAGILVTFILATAFFSREFHSKGLWLVAAGYITLTRSRAPLAPEPYRDTVPAAVVLPRVAVGQQ